MPANVSSPVPHDVLQHRLQVLQTEQTTDLTRLTTLELECTRLREACLGRAGAIAELEALCQPPIVATQREEDGVG